MFQQRIKRKMNSEGGSVILWTMMFVALFFLTISTVTVITILEIRQSTKIDSSTAAYLVAEAGVERAKNYAGSSFFDPTDPSNPATGVKDTGTKTGQIDNNTYIFQAVKAAAGTNTPYDSPSRNCVNSGAGVTTAKYCYYSQADVGGIRRKIDGQRKEIPINQGKSFLQGLPLVTLDGFNMLDLTPDSGTIASPQKFYLRWKVENINDIPDESQCTSSRPNLCFSFGLFEGGSGSLDANLKKSGTNTAIYLTGNTLETQSYTETAENTIYIPSTSTFAYFEMTYYVGGATVLKVSDSSGECRGALVRYDLSTQWMAIDNPYDMFFNRDTSNAASSGPTVDADGFGITLKSLNKEIKIRNIFFKVE